MGDTLRARLQRLEALRQQQEDDEHGYAGISLDSIQRQTDCVLLRLAGDLEPDAYLDCMTAEERKRADQDTRAMRSFAESQSETELSPGGEAHDDEFVEELAEARARHATRT